jgi:hypothetical protein
MSAITFRNCAVMNQCIANTCDPSHMGSHTKENMSIARIIRRPGVSPMAYVVEQQALIAIIFTTRVAWIQDSPRLVVFSVLTSCDGKTGLKCKLKRQQKLVMCRFCGHHRSHGVCCCATGNRSHRVRQHGSRLPRGCGGS